MVVEDVALPMPGSQPGNCHSFAWEVVCVGQEGGEGVDDDLGAAES